MKKTMTLAFIGFVGMASYSAQATTTNEVWNSWRKDMCADGINADVQRCYKSLYCPRGYDRVDMHHKVAMRQAKFAEGWKELFTSCSAECMPSHDHGHHHHHHHIHG